MARIDYDQQILLAEEEPIQERRGIRTSQTTSKSTWKHLFSSLAVLLTVMLERIAFYSLAGNLFLFLNQNPYMWASYNSMNALFIFTGTTFVSSLFGGWLADAILGRFTAILVAFVTYLAAYSFLPVLALSKNKVSDLFNRTNQISLSPLLVVPNKDYEPCTWLIYLLLIIIGISNGIVKANIAPFGAEQVREEGSKVLRMFFNWFYWSVNIGAFVALGGMAYIQQSTEYGFYLGYLIPTIFLGVAVIIFVLVRPLYIIHHPAGSVVTTVLLILKNAWISSRLQRRLSDGRESLPSWLDWAKARFGGRFSDNVVEDVKSLSTILIVFVFLVPYWLVYFQMQTTFQAQGLHLRLVFKGIKYENFSQLISWWDERKEYSKEIDEFSIPAAWLTIFDVIFLLIFIPLLDQLIYPFLDQKNCQISLLLRIILGMAFAVMSMLVAGALETYRLDLVQNRNETVVQIIGNTTYYAADLWVFWQIPQYALIGLSEVFASIAGVEFAYSQAPTTLQSTIMGFFCFSTGLGSFLGTGLLFAFKKVWLPKDYDVGNINYGQLNLYFFLLAGILSVTLFIFICVFRKLKIKKSGAQFSQESVSISNSVQEQRKRSQTEPFGSTILEQSTTTEIKPHENEPSTSNTKTEHYYRNKNLI
ncbi:solute carrier family 15 member 4-like [Tachypleus tridentatus]|uniref:solute carrier family 15 member 4-like n=1 Tax=Tachypleus tridentatus TaxID=6853 RepID=UPI003FD67870